MNVSSPVPKRLALAAGAVAIAVALAGFVLGVGNKPEGTVGQPATVSDTDPASAALPPSLELSGAFAWRDGDKISVYFSITNTGGRDVLKAATSDVAEEGRLVGEDRCTNDTESGSPQDSIQVLPSDWTIFKPGGCRIELIGTTRDLAPEESFELRLEFERAGLQAIEVVVKQGPNDP